MAIALIGRIGWVTGDPDHSIFRPPRIDPGFSYFHRQLRGLFDPPDLLVQWLSDPCNDLLDLFKEINA
jgi:hypothetical protein